MVLVISRGHFTYEKLNGKNLKKLNNTNSNILNTTKLSMHDYA